jgi:hypothetical protein
MIVPDNGGRSEIRYEIRAQKNHRHFRTPSRQMGRLKAFLTLAFLPLGTT